MYQAFTRGKKSAAGLDSWEPEELALFSPLACSWTAKLYKAIEEGARWPDGTEQAKAAFLEKEGAIPGEVMSYRVLLIMAVLYRRWASIRLRSMKHGLLNGP